MHTVYVIVPTHNRSHAAARCVEQLSAQTYTPLKIILIDHSDDGSSDRLARTVSGKATILRESPSLWWSAATQIGVAYALQTCAVGDYLLLLNDDVQVDQNFVESLVKMSEREARAVVGAVQREEGTKRLLNAGICIDWFHMRTFPASGQHAEEIGGLAGRGMLIPVETIRRIGGLRARWYPQVIADVEFSARARDKGAKLRVCSEAIVYTGNEPKSWMSRRKGWMHKYFDSKSPHNVIQFLLFFSTRGPMWLRVWAIPRFFILLPFRLISRSRRARACGA